MQEQVCGQTWIGNYNRGCQMEKGEKICKTLRNDWKMSKNVLIFWLAKKTWMIWTKFIGKTMRNNYDIFMQMFKKMTIYNREFFHKMFTSPSLTSGRAFFSPRLAHRFPHRGLQLWMAQYWGHTPILVIGFECWKTIRRVHDTT